MEREKDYNSTFELMTAIQAYIVGAYSRLFDIMWNVKVEKEKYLLELPYHINIIDELHINENAHSRILAKLLQYRNKTGRYVILESLVEFIKGKRASEEFDNIAIEAPIITQEARRIDLWIRDYKTKCALIFENKIYGAIDQESQLFRYIEESRDCDFNDNEIFVFYLPKFKNEMPSDQTWKSTETKQIFQNRFMVLSFRDDILEWLKTQVKPNIRPEDKFLSSALTQYIDYLEGMFSIRKINKSINMKLQDIIKEKLNLNNCSDDEALDKIQEAINDFQDVVNQLASMQNVILNKRKLERREMWKQLLSIVTPQISSIGEKFGLISNLGLCEEDSGFYISFKKEEWDLSIVLERYDDDTSFIYVGKPWEQDVDEAFLNSGIQIFEDSRWHRQHPYGWEHDMYHKKPETFINDIQNGRFEINLSKKVEMILNKINDQHIKMTK